jgi:hypothetical protein
VIERIEQTSSPEPFPLDAQIAAYLQALCGGTDSAAWTDAVRIGLTQAPARLDEARLRFKGTAFFPAFGVRPSPIFFANSARCAE